MEAKIVKRLPLVIITVMSSIVIPTLADFKNYFRIVMHKLVFKFFNSSCEVLYDVISMRFFQRVVPSSFPSLKSYMNSIIIIIIREIITNTQFLTPNLI